MRKILISLLALSTIALLGCGDDDKPTEPEPDPTVVVTAVAAGSAPSETSVNDAAWNTATAKTLTLTTGQLAVKNRPTAAMSIAPTISVKALTHANNLYLRLTWSDASFDVWPSVWSVDSLDGTSPVFVRQPDDQDELMVLFSGLPNNDWDLWHWRVLGSATSSIMAGGLIKGFAEGAVLRTSQDTILIDVGVLDIVTENVRAGFNQPDFLHNVDTCGFAGIVLPLAEAYNVTVMPSCWSVGDSVPGYVTHQGVADSSATVRGSRWETKAWATYASGVYTVVLKRALNTGHADDLVLSSGGDVTLKLAITNQGEFSFTQGSTKQGMTPEFFLRLP